MKYLVTIISLFILLSGTAVFADEGTLAKIQRQYESIESFQADFTQELSVAASREIDERHGQLFFQQPGLIRWETVSPEKELLVVGPELVWNYFEEEETAYQYAVEDVLGSAMVLRILSGQARLDEDFITEEDLSEDAEYTVIRLRPRNPEPNLVEATIWVDPDTFLLRRIKAVDFYGNTNQVELEKLVLNSELDPDLFEFTPPDGVAVR
ncbi:outer membrane lipoprotein carrier protein [Desulfonatronum thiosulfatophilum]|uniref:Outer-membrane lipoprotein carrier protein n=1 Tax=Desulfonatronum thiosulfatophilum TaxID=617002 RepID=A0A1G6BZ02_9BACT|nr:outer membrane lipoprotein chaperone LolA [Desulfonatronum thiosulfatophilum]SDB25798.1 outer membrane lipoprotein carrier protein [Desulfonatronum thiosulfatophilum]